MRASLAVWGELRRWVTALRALPSRVWECSSIFGSSPARAGSIVVGGYLLFAMSRSMGSRLGVFTLFFGVFTDIYETAERWQSYALPARVY